MDNEIKKLRDELTSKLDALQLKVDILENRLAKLDGTQTDASSNVNLDSANKSISEQIIKQATSSETIPAQKNITNSAAKTSTEHASLSQKIVNNRPTKSEGQSAKAKVSTSRITSNALSEIVMMLLGPFSSIFYQMLKVYQRYQEQGRGPAFLMTAAGILALVMGFGFLLQYSFSNYLGTGGKIATGFISAIAIVALGIKISNTRSMLSEFGAALIGLGIILNYLCAYFISGHFNIVGPTIGLTLLAVITSAAYWLAVHYDTKTVAVLSLLGGASTPLFLGDLSQVSSIYFVYLGFLVATMLHLAYKIKWPYLIQFTLIISIAMTQYLFFEQGAQYLINNSVFIIVLHVVFYLFSYACLHNISQTKQKIAKSILLVIVANIIFFIFVMYQSVGTVLYLGWIYIVNALALIVFYRFNWLVSYIDNNIKKDFNALLLLQAGLLIGFGILFLVSPSLLGLIWGVEGLALIYVGFRFNIPSIRYEGHATFLIGMVSALYKTILWFDLGINFHYGAANLITLSYDTGWMNLIVFGVVLWLAAQLLQLYKTKSLTWEKTACYWAQELFSLWLSLAFMISLFLLFRQELLLLSIFPLFILLYRAKKYSLAITEFLGLAHYFLFALQILISASQVNSFSLSDQNWIGIAARIEIFFTLWLIAEFYKRFYPSSKLINFADSLRISFYVLIPLLFIPKVIKSYDEFFPIALWLSASIAIMLFTRLKYKALKIEFYILTGLAWFVTVFAMTADYLNEWYVKANWALFTGLAFFAITSIIWKAFNGKYQKPTESDLYPRIKDYVHLHHWSVYYLASVIFVMVFGLTENLSFTFLTASIYFFGLCLLWPKIEPAKISIHLSYSLLAIFSVLNLYAINMVNAATMHDNLLPVYLMIQAAFLGFLLHKNIPSSKLLRQSFGGYLTQLWIYNGFLIFVYSSSVYYWFPEQLKILLSILLVLHAALLLMLTLKSEFSGLLKLSVILFVGSAIKILMFDMADFSLIQKIIAFMIIGALLLGASYMYQKMQHKTQVLKSD
ncbi:hypothetical protein MNBD_GAMMA22-2842 [hydrothermal vent metagenome]|uniref:DUF2339 domain-containing protein n=1 Tax=hydrothermal vent metagenome TaxID=652676 RepID=A0A3B1A4N5_9ZZZZ